MKRVYSAYYKSDGYPFHNLADKVETVWAADQLEEKDSLLVVWGGADISPSLYNHKESSQTYPGGKRDWIEWALMQGAIKRGIPIMGVCRGAQMACAAAGGFLIQDVDNHVGGHSVKTINGTQILVNSLHHQMMFAPPEVEAKLLAWCETPRSPSYIIEDDRLFQPPPGFLEPEAYYFPKIKALAVQWHPEMMAENAAATVFILNQMKELQWL